MLQSLILLGATALVGAEFRSRLWPRHFCGLPGMVLMTNLASCKCIESSVDASESDFVGCYCLGCAEFWSRLWPRLFCGPSADLRLTPFQVKKLMRARSAFLTEEVGMMNESASVIGCQSG